MTDNELKKGIQEFEKKESRAQMIYRLVQIVFFFLVFLSWAIGWQFGLVAIVWLCWNFFWYEQGYRSQTIDEYEDGYHTDGLRYMFKSWIAFAVLALLFLLMTVDF